MRTVLLAAALLSSALAASSAVAQSRGERGLVIDVKPRSWLDAGSSVPVGYGRDYVTNTNAFGGSPINGIGSRFQGDLPERGGSGVRFDFLGANAVR